MKPGSDGRTRALVAVGLGAAVWLGGLAFSPAALSAPGPAVESPRGDPPRRAAPGPAETSPRDAAPRPAAARPVKPWAKGVSAADRSKALALYKEGNKHFEDSQYKEALARYLQAVKLWDHPAIRYNIAECYVNLERPLAAHRNLKRALRFGEAGLKTHYKQARTYLRLLSGRLGRIEVACREPGAKVTLDGVLLFTAPGKARRTVQVGKHVVVVSKPKFLTETRTLTVLPRKTIRLNLAPLPLRTIIKMKRRWKRWIPWTVLVSGAVVAAAVGVPLIVLAKSSFNKYDTNFETECSNGCFPSERSGAQADLLPQARNMRDSGIALVAISGAVIAAGVTLVLLNQPRAHRVNPRSLQKKRTEESVLLLPAVSPGRGAMTTGFRF
ncbi:MAG: tetratricopeptide repeat protein [bacterium]